MSSIAVARPAARAALPTPPASHRLRVVPSPGSAGSGEHERVLSWPVVLALLVVLAASLTFGAQLRSITTTAERVDGHVMVEPGSSLVEVAQRTAPAGTDPAAQLVAIQELNGLTDTRVGTWTVVLLPAN
jgi:hypothetical protein